MRRKNIRTRCQQSDSDEEDERSAAAAIKIRAKQQRACLSFADEMCSDQMPRKKQAPKQRKSKPSGICKVSDEPAASDELTLKVKPLETLPSTTKQKEVAKPKIPVALPTEDTFDEPCIPDAQAIYQARLRRQQMREALDRGEIPLREEPHDEYVGSIYSKDEMGYDSDGEQSFVQFKTSIHIAAEERQLVRDRFLTCEQGSESEASDSSANDQENFSTWELEQIRKGVGIRPQALAGHADEVTEQMVAAAQNILASKNTVERTSDETIPKFRKTMSVAQIRENLIMRIQGLESAIRQYREERKALEDACEGDSTKQSECKENLERCHEFFSALKEYAFDIRECMKEKLPQVEDAERRAVELQKAHIQLIVKRRIREVRDQDFEYSPAKTITTASFDQDPKTPLDPDRQQRAFARQQRRLVRKQRKLANSETADSDGFSSDDEDLGDENKLAHDEGALLNRFAAIWYDVNENFFQLANVLNILGSLSRKSPQGHSLVLRYLSSLLAPIARCACFFWNPLKSSLEEEKWFKQLAEYCSESDKHRVIMQDIIQRVIVPAVVRYARIYDPGSGRQTLTLSTSVQYSFSKCADSYRQSPQAKDLVEIIQAAIVETLDKEVFIPLYPKPVLQRQDCSAFQFFRRQLSFQIKLYGNVLMWSGFLPEEFLVTNAVDRILNKCIVLSLRCLGHSEYSARKCTQIAKRTPGELLVVSGEKTISQLEPFCIFVKQMAQWALAERQNVIYENLKAVLIDLRALDHAVELGFLK